MTKIKICDLFRIKSGDFHAKHELDEGDIPLVSCGDINHGYVGRFDIPPDKRYTNTITVAYNGIPLTVKYRPYEFGAKDDIGVLLPHEPISQISLVYIAAILNSKRWRFSYGRKCFKEKLGSIRITLPVTRRTGTVYIDELRIRNILGECILDRRPPHSGGALHMPKIRWKEKRLNAIFDLQRGNFHSLKDLGKGSYATVSRTENDNGIIGYFEKPDGSTVYPPGLITISTVSGDAYVQAKDFIATDNVIVCVPLVEMHPATACFIASMINHQKWRYSYGRQCYKEKLSALTIQLPWRNEHIDETAIRTIVERQPYWKTISSQFGQEY